MSDNKRSLGQILMPKRKFSICLFRYELIYNNLDNLIILKLVKHIKKIPGQPRIKTIFTYNWDVSTIDEGEEKFKAKVEAKNNKAQRYNDLIKDGYPPLKASMIVYGEKDAN